MPLRSFSSPIGRTILSALTLCVGGVGKAQDFSAPALQPTRFALRMETAPDATLAGIQVVQGVRLGERTALVAQFDAAKGEYELGVLSAGLAVRRSFDDDRMFAGVNGFFDALQDSDGFSYQRVGVGAEFSRGQLTVRANGYMTVGGARERRVRVHKVKEEIGSEYYVEQVTRTTKTIFEKEGASGWDAEAEWAFIRQPKLLDPRLAIGYYGLGTDHPAAYQSGLRARAECRVGSHVVTGVEWRQDSSRLGQEWRAEVRFEFPFGGKRGTPPAAVASADDKVVKLPSDGKTAKTFVPPQPTFVAGNPALFDPVRRSLLPQVISGTRRQTGKYRTGYNLSDTDDATAPDCGCHSGSEPLIFQ